MFENNYKRFPKIRAEIFSDQSISRMIKKLLKSHSQLDELGFHQNFEMNINLALDYFKLGLFMNRCQIILCYQIIWTTVASQFWYLIKLLFRNRNLMPLQLYNITRKYPLRRYILVALTHTWDRHLGTLKCSFTFWPCLTL